MRKIKKGSAIYFYLLFQLLKIPFNSSRMVVYAARKQGLVNKNKKITDCGIVTLVSAALDVHPVWLFILQDQENAAKRHEESSFPGMPFAPAKLSIPMSYGMNERSARSTYSRMISAGMLERRGRGLVCITPLGSCVYNTVVSCMGELPPLLRVLNQ